MGGVNTVGFSGDFLSAFDSNGRYNSLDIRVCAVATAHDEYISSCVSSGGAPTLLAHQCSEFHT